ncbi:MAG: ribosomal protein S6 modification protein [Candidatus Tectimicrobiota bacterium]|nr:MAG: ribosomal protein S6 modification protein [Candidatus Tectomicrobia bacterium]
MAVLIVVNNPKDWPLAVPGVEVVAARAYLTEPRYSALKGGKVFNLCRSYRYQSLGYYVSLLAEARGHKPLPSVTTLQDFASQALVRLLSDDLDALVQRSLAPLRSEEFVLSIYFGRNLARRYDRLSRQLYGLFQAPLLRAHFVRRERWQLRQMVPIPASDIPAEHRDFVVQVATEYFAGRRTALPRRAVPRYDLAILYDPSEALAPSDEAALQRFVRAATALGLRVEVIGRDDYGRLAEFDALFLRQTTHVNHYTYRFARRAAGEGLVVIDDPVSILKCTNKVYLAELLHRHRIPTPRTLVVHRDNLATVPQELGFPCVLKTPDGAFSQGVIKVDSAAAFFAQAERLLERSDLIIAQEFVPTPFDWRVGILDHQPLYVCKYHMAAHHWQILRRDRAGRNRYGKVETLPVSQAPRQVVRTALRAAALIGDGLYGVDLKQVGRRCYVIEVNDNPNIDAGVEDAVLGEALYRRIMQVFLDRLERRSAGILRP